MSIRPEFTWRDFQHVTVKSAVYFNDQDPTWTKVAKDRMYSHRYGFGKLDAYRLVEAAKSHILVQNQTFFESPIITSGAEMRGNTLISSHFEVTREHVSAVRMARLEHVTVTVNIPIKPRGAISIDLTSPSGSISALATQRVYDSNSHGFRNWTFMSVKHWLVILAFLLTIYLF
jgi:kexin